MKVKKGVLFVCSSLLLFSLSACGINDDNGDPSSSQPESSQYDEYAKLLEIYELYKQGGGTLSFEEWVASIKDAHPSSSGPTQIINNNTTEANIADVRVDENGDLIVTFDDGQEVNAGHIIDVELGTDGLIYYPMDDGNCGVSVGTASRLREIVIPEKHKGMYVTEIVGCGFNDCSNLIRLTLPSNLKTISDSAFDAPYLVEIINKSELDITCGSRAYGDIALNARSIVTDEKDTKVSFTNDFALFDDESGQAIIKYLGNSESAVAIPDGITKIFPNAFLNKDITDVSIPASVTLIDEKAFFGCYKLANVSFAPNSKLETIGLSAFSECVLSSINLPNSVKSIDDYAFLNCSHLNNVVLPNSLEHLGYDAFQINNFPKSNFATYNNCYYLGSSNNPYLVYLGMIDTNANELSFNSNCKFIIGGLSNYESDPYNSDIDFIEIPSGAKEVNIHLLNYFGNLRNLVVPSSVTSFASQYYYYGYYGNQINMLIEDQTLPTWWHQELSDRFKPVLGFKEYYTLDGYSYLLQEIDNVRNAVLDKIAPEVVDFALPSSVKGYNVTGMSADVFRNHPRTFESVVIPNFLEVIEYNSFKDCADLTSVTFEANSHLTRIASEAFCYCSSLESITIPHSVEVIENRAFANCTSLNEFAIVEGSPSLREIGSFAFYYCIMLHSIEFAPTLQIIGDGAFQACNKLENTNLAALHELRQIGNYAFGGCNKLNYLFIPSSVEYVGSQVANRNTVILTTLQSKPLSWPSNWSYASDNSTDKSFVVWGHNGGAIINGFHYELSIVDNAKYAYLVSVDQSVSNFELPSVIEEDYVVAGVAPRVFRYSEVNGQSPNFSSIVVPECITSFSNEMFSYCYRVSSFTMGTGVTKIGSEAFPSSSSLHVITYLGTAEQWEQIQISSSAFVGSHITTIHCTDNDIVLSD